MKKVVFPLIGLGLVLSLTFAQMTSFTGSTSFQEGMTLDQAAALATVTAEDAAKIAQEHAAVMYEDAEAELSVVDGFLVWTVDLGSKTVYVDITDPTLISAQEVMAEAYAEEGEEYEDEDEYEEYEEEYEDEDEEEYKDEDKEEYEDEDDD